MATTTKSSSPVEHEGHGHDPLLHHQFEDMHQQTESYLVGMWSFLVTEIMFFGAVFVAYAVYRSRFGAAFSLGTHLLDIKSGGINTLILMASSFTMTLAVVAARQGKRQQIVNLLLVTLALGAVFLGIKSQEYKAKFEHHLVPGDHFDLAHALQAHTGEGAASAQIVELAKHADPRQVQMFFSFYFTMTGLHLIHMLIGMGVLLFILRMAQKGRFGPEYHNPLEVTSLYWHFVDMVWIFLFPMLYLLGRH